MKLLYQPASPFVAKCRMTAAHLGIELDEVVVDATNQAPELLSVNPLGKIPCLIDDDAKGDDPAIYDSRVITRYLNAKANGALYPREGTFSTPRMEALADGIADAAVAIAYEKRFRSEEKVEQSWIDRQWSKVMRGLEVAGSKLPPMGSDIDAGSIALASALGYLDLRYQGEWQGGNGAVFEWQTRFDENHPKLAALKPSA